MLYLIKVTIYMFTFQPVRILLEKMFEKITSSIQAVKSVVGSDYGISEKLSTPMGDQACKTSHSESADPYYRKKLFTKRKKPIKYKKIIKHKIQKKDKNIKYKNKCRKDIMRRKSRVKKRLCRRKTRKLKLRLVVLLLTASLWESGLHHCNKQDGNMNKSYHKEGWPIQGVSNLEGNGQEDNMFWKDGELKPLHKKLNKLTRIQNGNGLGTIRNHLLIAHWNMGAKYWKKKIEDIEAVTLQYRPDILIISEANLLI